MGKTNRRKPPVEQYDGPETPVMAPTDIFPVVKEVVATPAVAPITPATPVATPYLDTLVCPLCGERKFSHQLVGSKCYHRYVDTATRSLVGGKRLSLKDWFKGVLPLALKAAERTFEEAKKRLADVSNRVRDKAFTAVKEAAAGQSVHMHVFLAAREQQEKEMWGREGGSKAYRDRMVTERAVTMLRGIMNGTIDPTPAPRPKEEAKSGQTPTETPRVQSAGN